MKIKSIKKISCDSKRYDIQTKKTNNFFANGILVHNSLIKCFWYNDHWHIATNGTIDADDASTNDNISFKSLFFDIISKEHFNELTKNFDKGNTYLFELIHPASQIVVNYNKKELVFLGMIKNELSESDTVIDYDILSIRKKMEKIFGELPIRYPRVFDLKNINDLNELSKIADEENVNGNDFEGFVVYHAHNKKIIGRVKIKSPKYINLHHVVTGESVTNNLVDVLMKNEIDEFEVYLEKLPNNVAEEYKSLKNKYFKLIKYLSEEGDGYREKAKTFTRKELAEDIHAHVRKSCNGFMFKLIDNCDITPEKLLKDYGIKKVKSLLIS